MQIQKFFPIDDRLAAAAEAAEKSCAADFARIEDNAAYNGAKVLAAQKAVSVNLVSMAQLVMAMAIRAERFWIKS
ncbi:MAG: hypothetical protein ACLT29_08760 [Ruminococcus callidus]